MFYVNCYRYEHNFCIAKCETKAEAEFLAKVYCYWRGGKYLCEVESKSCLLYMPENARGWEPMLDFYFKSCK